MVKVLAIFLSLLYNVVSIGATLQVHTCGSNILWSISKTENVHNACPICDSTQTGTCHSGDCQDIELKLDQLSDELFANSKDMVQLFQSATLVLPWIVLPDARTFSRDSIPTNEVLVYSNSSPPTYLLHCTFRI